MPICVIQLMKKTLAGASVQSTLLRMASWVSKRHAVEWKPHKINATHAFISICMTAKLTQLNLNPLIWGCFTPSWLSTMHCEPKMLRNYGVWKPLKKFIHMLLCGTIRILWKIWRGGKTGRIRDFIVVRQIVVASDSILFNQKQLDLWISCLGALP